MLTTRVMISFLLCAKTMQRDTVLVSGSRELLLLLEEYTLMFMLFLPGGMR